VCTAHPADQFDAAAAELLATMTGARVVCINLREHAETSGAPTLEEMVRRIEDIRRGFGFSRWIFWGLSGGGWLAQIYAQRYPEALTGVVIESACLCFRERLADPACVLSPLFPQWREPLQAAGLFSEFSNLEPQANDGTEWLDIDGIGSVFRRREGPALLVSPGPVTPEMKRMMPRLWSFDSRPWIRSVRVPSLVLCGTADPIVPLGHARAVHHAIAGSTLVEIEGGGHVPVLQKRPEVTAAFQAFVSTLSPE
jgi:pimeloyl-ACP methyl ester carboxylesterase